MNSILYDAPNVGTGGQYGVCKNYNLSNGWLICTDPDNNGKKKGFAKKIQEGSKPIPVPGVIQEVFTDYHGVVWYYYQVSKLPVRAGRGEKLILRIGAADYFSELFIDGRKITENEGPENELETDVTKTLKDGSLIAVRIINVKLREEIDGFEMSVTPHRNKDDGGYVPGCCYNSGGIMLPVTLYVTSSVRITDVFVRTDWKTGDVSLETTVQNDTGRTIGTVLEYAIKSQDTDTAAAVVKGTVQASPGENVFTFKTSVADFLLWDIDSPNVYDVEAVCKGKGLPSASYFTHFGFRDFRIENGFFTLNGRRIFLKSAHTGNHMPEGLSVVSPKMPYLEFRDFQLAKASGFNCLRFIATQATPRQLDYCDRLGLMIYQETYASWCMADSDKASKRFNDSISAEIKRDRNHPCITIWGMLNETCISDAFYAARDALPMVRSLDDTRLCIFSSGRFDLRFKSDRDKADYGIGCASNPGSLTWEHVWGDDGNTDESAKRLIGDVHDYPDYPHSDEVMSWYRTYGHNTKPCFFSEYGVGSALNVIENCLDYEKYGTDESAPDYKLMRSIRDRFLKDFYLFGMDSVYASPVDFLRDSEKYNAESRRAGFDMIRSNPQFVGFNLTGLLDHAICGEGPFTFFRRFKPLNFDVFQDGWADLRWCLFTGKTNLHPGETQHLEAVLADFDVLGSGTYDVTFAVTDMDGRPYFTKDVSFSVPQSDKNGLRLTAYPVFEEDVVLNLKPGKYSFRAFLKNGGYAGASEKSFYVTKQPGTVKCPTVGLCGISPEISDFLTNHGVNVTEKYDGCSTILVGSVNTETGKKLIELAKNGAKIIFACEKPLSERDETCGYGRFIPLKDYFCGGEPMALYHKESVMNVSHYTEDLKTGFFDWDYYGSLMARTGFVTSQKADEYVSVNMFVGGPGEYHSSIALAEYKLGKGSILLNTLPVLENVGKTPSADILLLNLLK